MKISVIGLGYVGLPLAVSLSNHYEVTGFDINKKRISELLSGIDNTNEISEKKLKLSNLTYTDNPKDLKTSDIIIVTVPTPIDEHKNPNLKPVESASKTVGSNLKKGAIVVYESTVYPGVTEDICVPILEETSGLKWKEDFFVGYSPERINPGDKVHTVENIAKVVSGDTEKTLNTLAELYGSIIKAEIFKASSIKVAEAAKVIENTQRDVNIALMNELSLIFNKMDIDTYDVLEAAGTKWNFLKFFPGLVGGHCIGVDPYYLTFKAEHLGYLPEVILSGRRINDNMGNYIAQNTIKLMIKNNKNINGGKVLILGITFKEDVPDIRNTRVVDIYNELIDYGINVDVVDPHASISEVKNEYGINIYNNLPKEIDYDAVIVAIKHSDFVTDYTLEKITKLQKKNPILIDIKALFNKQEALNLNIHYWRL